MNRASEPIEALHAPEDRETRLDAVITAFLEASERGERPVAEEWISQHADLAPDLADFLASLKKIDQAVAPLRALAAPFRTFGDYELLAELGRGGMGIVYKAHDRRLNRLVALKLIRAGQQATPAEAQRFRNEAEAAAHLDHPHIVPIYHVGEVDAQFYFTMQLLDGGSLTRNIERYHAQPRATARLTAALARAVHHAHQHGILHRDLKPSNILLDSNGEPRVADFGLAKWLDVGETLTETGQVLGTPAYMAPELASGRKGAATTAADVYGVGAILYELLTGRPPFRGSNRLDTVLKVVHDDPVPPRKLDPKIPADLETICLKCLEKEPSKRYASAGDIADDLGRYLSNEPILARPAGNIRRAIKWAKRRPALAGLVGVSVSGLLVLGGVVAYSADQLRNERDFALAQKRIADNERDAANRARDETDRQRQRAQANFERAREAVDQMLTRIGDEKLRNVPWLEDLQRDLLEDALRFNQRFLTDYGDDPAVRAEVARAYYRAATIRATLGKHQEAAAAFRDAIRIQERLVNDSAGDPTFQKELSPSCLGLAFELQQVRTFSDAERCVNQALTHLETLSSRFPAHADYRQDLAIVHNRKAAILSHMRRWSEVEPEYRSALALLEPPAGQPDSPSYRRQLAWTLRDYGRFLAIKDRGEDAVRTLRDAIQRFESLMHDFPKEVEYRHSRVQTLSNLATYFSEQGRTKDAEAAFDRTIRDAKSLVQDFPRVPTYRKSLAIAIVNFSSIVGNQGHSDQAMKLQEEAARLYEQLVVEAPTIPDHRRALTETWNSLGASLWHAARRREAEEFFRKSLALGEKLVAEFSDTADYHSELGQSCALLSISLRERNQLRDAQLRIQEAIRHQEAAVRLEPDRWKFRLLLREHLDHLSRTFLLCHDHVSASRVAEDASRRYPDSWEAQYDAGCTYSCCIRLAEGDKQLSTAQRLETARAYADRALVFLRAAVAKGFTNAEHMKKDPDLDALRNRADFQSLVADIEKKARAGSNAKPVNGKQ
jgi:serine/threonine-protein kinase